MCLYICKICRFIVIKNRTKKYISRIGQNTGTSKTEKKVITMDVPTPFVHANQNLNAPGVYCHKFHNRGPNQLTKLGTVSTPNSNTSP